MEIVFQYIEDGTLELLKAGFRKRATTEGYCKLNYYKKVVISGIVQHEGNRFDACGDCVNETVVSTISRLYVHAIG